MTEQTKSEPEVLVTQNAVDVDIHAKCSAISAHDDIREDKRAARDFKFFALKTFTITLSVICLGVMSSFIYAYAHNDKQMDQGILDTVFSTIVEVIKVLL